MKLFTPIKLYRVAQTSSPLTLSVRKVYVNEMDDDDDDD
jgi:hypothetical protein